MDIKEKEEIVDIPVMCEFKDVFPGELPRLPL